MTTDLTLNISVTIHTSKSKVWSALTDPEQIKKYLFGTETTTDWKVGSPITFSGMWEGKSYIDKGTILQIEKEKVLKYSYWSSFSGTEDKPENYANITYALEDHNGNTVFHLTQDGIKTKEAHDTLRAKLEDGAEFFERSFRKIIPLSSPATTSSGGRTIQWKINLLPFLMQKTL